MNIMKRWGHCSTLDPMFARGLVMKAAKELYNERPAAEKIAEAQKAEEEQAQTIWSMNLYRSQLMILEKKLWINLYGVTERDKAEEDQAHATTDQASYQNTIDSMGPVVINLDEIS